MKYEGKLGFRGQLSIKVIRGKPPTRRQRIVDFIAKLLGRYTT